MTNWTALLWVICIAVGVCVAVGGILRYLKSERCPRCRGQLYVPGWYRAKQIQQGMLHCDRCRRSWTKWRRAHERA